MAIIWSASSASSALALLALVLVDLPLIFCKSPPDATCESVRIASIPPHMTQKLRRRITTTPTGFTKLPLISGGDSDNVCKCSNGLKVGSLASDVPLVVAAAEGADGVAAVAAVVVVVPRLLVCGRRGLFLSLFVLC